MLVVDKDNGAGESQETYHILSVVLNILIDPHCSNSGSPIEINIISATSGRVLGGLNCSWK